MKFTRLLPVALCAIALVAATAFTEDEKPKPLSAAELEAKMMELGDKYPAHDRLQAFVGTWIIEGKGISASMGEYPIGGTAVTTSLWEGRFLATTYEGPSPMGTIYGTGHMGYDRLTSKYQSTWMMSMGTTIQTNAGTYDEASKTYTLLGSLAMPDGSTMKMRQVTVLESADKFQERHFHTPQGGKEELAVELNYTRKTE
ncbi:MAG: DUF1579 family protein [Planctomycetota bacterium]|nr:DUF1579 family protein [Planctomycetota bacterium]